MSKPATKAAAGKAKSAAENPSELSTFIARSSAWSPVDPPQPVASTIRVRRINNGFTCAIDFSSPFHPAVETAHSTAASALAQVTKYLTPTPKPAKKPAAKA